MNSATVSKHSLLTGQLRLTKQNSAETVIFVSGNWSNDAQLLPVVNILAELHNHTCKTVIFKTEQLEAWGSRLPTQLLKIMDYCQAQHIAVDTQALPEGVQGLLTLARAVPERPDVRKVTRTTSLSVRVGELILNSFTDIRNLLEFIGATMLALAALLTGKARFRWHDLLICIQESGPAALGIVSLISVLVGLILAFVGALQLSMFGAQIYIADLVALGTVREMGTLMTAIIMSGRTGAAFAAQLGTMNVNSEIDAYRTMGISPIEFLVLPRLLSLLLMMPFLCIFADLMGIMGGAIVSINLFDITGTQYLHEIQKSVHLKDFAVGIFKSFVFALLIATAGCMRGMQCGQSASAVGDATTTAVVNSIVYIVIADSVITLLTNQLHI